MYIGIRKNSEIYLRYNNSQIIISSKEPGIKRKVYSQWNFTLPIQIRRRIHIVEGSLFSLQIINNTILLTKRKYHENITSGKTSGRKRIERITAQLAKDYGISWRANVEAYEKYRKLYKLIFHQNLNPRSSNKITENGEILIAKSIREQLAIHKKQQIYLSTIFDEIIISTIATKDSIPLTVSKKYKVTIPKDIRTQLSLSQGEYLHSSLISLDSQNLVIHFSREG